ncbi:unnamed protein product [Rotaria socialis]|uniref:Uncharacterized protein n=1 Tax=Rotaria socialis TaxID=392032 RepID=A0A818C3D6_9BILA|nr:unnamed protein product [Rotaria socialis]CAF4467440.1 unnamed protein product [Rotaria socialis]
MNKMSNRSFCGSNKVSQNYQPTNSTYDHNFCKLPVINNGASEMMHNTNLSVCKPSLSRGCTPQTNENYLNQCSHTYNRDVNIGVANNLSKQIDFTSTGSAIYNARTPSYNSCKINCSPSGDTSFQKFSSSPPKLDCNKTKLSTTNLKKNQLIRNSNNSYAQRLMTPNLSSFNCSTSNMNTSTGQTTSIRDRQLANEILQKAGIQSNMTSNDCLEVITDGPVTTDDNVNCDPNPLCMKKLSDTQECYEQSIVVRHLQPPRPPVPPPIIIRERCAQQPPPQPPIIIRQIPPRPSTPPPLIIRECPPPIPEMQEPTIIDREIPPPPPPPRQVIVERLPTPPPKPRSIIVEKWLPYEEPQDRPCIVEKATRNEMPPVKNVIIQYESLEPKIQSQCINGGISCVDPKQFVNDRTNENAEPDHIKCQLNPQALAAIGIQNDNKKSTSYNPSVVRTNPPCFYQQQTRFTCPSIPPISGHSMMTNGCYSPKSSYSQMCNSTVYRLQQPNINTLSAPAVCLPQCFNKYNTAMLTQPDNQGLTKLTRSRYNPWATTYQVSYTNKARGMCRTR